MQKLSFILTLAAGLFLSSHAGAQSNADFFAGKWTVIITGTPNGDAVMNFVFEKKDGKLTGVVQDSTGKEISKVTQIEEKDKTITAYFTAQSYDVNLLFDPIDNDHVKGNLMGMFDATGVRVKDGK